MLARLAVILARLGPGTPLDDYVAEFGETSYHFTTLDEMDRVLTRACWPRRNCTTSGTRECRTDSWWSTWIRIRDALSW